VLAAAAEALAGSHPRFRAPLLEEAAAELRRPGAQSRVPWRLSPAWVLALAATALSPLSLASAPPPPAPRLGGRSLLDPSLPAGGGGGGAPDDLPQPGAEPSGASYGVAEEGAEAREAQSLELPLDVIAALSRAAGPRASGGGQGSSGPGEGAEPSTPRDALLEEAQADLAGALRDLEALKSAAESGDRAARVRLDQLRQALAKAGGGGASAAGEVPETSSGGGAGPQAQPGEGAAPLPAPLAGAVERYFGS